MKIYAHLIVGTSEKRTYVNYLTEMKVLVVSKRNLSTLGPQTCTEPVWAKEKKFHEVSRNKLSLMNKKLHLLPC